MERRCKDTGEWEEADFSQCVRRPANEAVAGVENFAQELGFTVSICVETKCTV